MEADGADVLFAGRPRELELQVVLADDRRRFLAPFDRGDRGRRGELLEAEIEHLARAVQAV